MKVVKEFNKAPGQQWIICLVNRYGSVSYVLKQALMERSIHDVILGQSLCRSVMTFKSIPDAAKFVKKYRLDSSCKIIITDFVQEMKNLIAMNQMSSMLDEHYCRITCENSIGEKLYIKNDATKQSNSLYTEGGVKNSLVVLESKAAEIIKGIQDQKSDKYKNYKTEML